MTAPDPLAAASTAPWSRADSVLWRRTLAGVVVLPVNGSAEPVVLRGAAAGIWELLAEPMRPGDLVAALAATYRVDEALVADDISAALDMLLELGALCRS